MGGATSSLLRTSGLTKRFGGLTAVSDLSFELRSGEILGLIGPNGAGKSTVFNLISGFTKPTAGRLELFGRDCTGSSALTISRMGLVRTFQHGSYMKAMTVRDNILIGTLQRLRGPARRKCVAETAEMLGLTSCLDRIAGSQPHGIQRLVSIAIALAARPRVLCLDEPLTGLNQTEVGGVLGVFQRIRNEFGTTILLVEHNTKAVMAVCDRIVVLHHGQQLAEGPPLEITSNADVIAAYLGPRHDR